MHDGLDHASSPPGRRRRLW